MKAKIIQIIVISLIMIQIGVYPTVSFNINDNPPRYHLTNNINQPHNLEEVQIAYYNGSGAWSVDNIIIPHLAEWMGCNLTEIQEEDIIAGCLDNQEFDVLIWPGGHYPDYWLVGQEGKQEIQEFVSDGGGYIGICAGAYWAADYMIWKDHLPDYPAPDYKQEGHEENLDLFPGVAVGPIFEIADRRPTSYNMTRINFMNRSHLITDSLPESMIVWYAGGPYLQPYENATNVTILATFDVTGDPAIVTCDYGDGRVFLISPHTEVILHGDQRAFSITGWQWPTEEEYPPEYEYPVEPEDEDGWNMPIIVEALKWVVPARVEKSILASAGSGTVVFNPDAGFLEELDTIYANSSEFSDKADTDFPHDFFNFSVDGVLEGQEINLSITLPTSIPIGTQWYFKGTNQWSFVPVGDDDGDNILTLSLVDGGQMDIDGETNGIIVHLGGPSPTHSQTPIPTSWFVVILFPFFTMIVLVQIIRKKRC